MDAYDVIGREKKERKEKREREREKKKDSTIGKRERETWALHLLPNGGCIIKFQAGFGFYYVF